MPNGDTTINTSGGTSIGSKVQTGRDFIGRDQTNITVINWASLGTEFIDDLNRVIKREQKEQEEAERKQKSGSRSNSTTQAKIEWLNQKITEIEHFDWSKAEEAYCNKVIKLYDRVRILGASVDVPLGNIFTQVYILDKPTARQRHDIEELRNQSKDRLDFQYQLGRRIHGLSLVKGKQNLFILGKPGAGKTTFLKYITVQAARKQLPRIPIFVSLNQWADSKWSKDEEAALLPFMVEQFAICDFPDATFFIEYLLQKGRALVLFDGLDEVKQEESQRRRLTRLLQNFAHKYDKSQHLITCRIAASDYAFTGFSDVEVADFTPNQVREYAYNWFNGQVKKLDTFTTELTKPDNKGLAELCNTPLLLSLLCLTFDNNLRFPPSRVELYEDALETLLRKWDSNRQIQRDEIYRELSHKRKLQLLMRIAVPSFEKGELFFRQRDLENWIVDYLVTLPSALPADMIDGTTILKAIEAQHSILVERAQGIYSFSHLTFQEYFTARYIVENQGQEMISKLMGHLTDRRWREVFLLTASLLNNANDFVMNMRSAIDQLFKDMPTLSHMLTWAYKRTLAANVPVERHPAVQLVYIILACTCVHELTHHEGRSLVHNLALTLALDHDYDREYNLDFPLILQQIRAPDLATNPILTLKLARITSTSEVDYSLYYTWAYAKISAYEHIEHHDNQWQAALNQFPTLLQGIAILAENIGLDTLAQRLRILTVPPANTSWQSWRKYTATMFAILHEERDLAHKWDFNQKEIEKINDYFYANELLIQCLKVAAVSDRQTVLNGLLLPPEHDKKI
jgi:predicted NACHT family NTPase